MEDPKVIEAIKKKNISCKTKEKAIREARQIAKDKIGGFQNGKDIITFCCWSMTPSGHNFWENIHKAGDIIMDNYICIDGDKIPISQETAGNLKERFGKPEIRHGDYGYRRQGGTGKVCTNEPRVFIKLDGSIKGFDETGCCTQQDANEDTASSYKIFGNVFDLIKEKDCEGEDLEKFEWDCCKIKLTPYGRIELHCAISTTFLLKGSPCSYSISNAQKIHEKLGQIIATAKRKKKDC